jgi:GWxTD domain-containing protein
MNRLVLVLAVFLSAGAVLAQPVQELFQKTKAQVKAGSWDDALKTMTALDAEAAKPGNEAFHKQLEGPLAFYRGVCEANLGQADKARASFQVFLGVQPNASIDPAMYSKKAVAAFDEARKASAPPDAASGGSPSLFAAYQEFKPPPNISDPPDEKWAEGPVQWLMTAQEKKTWAGLQAGADRVEFVEKFWQARNPTSDSADNAFKTGFERRAAFADAHFVQDEKKRGSLTDRGMVFVLLGPPTYGGRKPIRSDEDVDEQSGMTFKPVDQRVSPEILKAPESNPNHQEVWHYRRELLPKGVGYLQVDVVFITRKGYGINVLQRDSPTLTTLDAARMTPE